MEKLNFFGVMRLFFFFFFESNHFGRHCNFNGVGGILNTLKGKCMYLKTIQSGENNCPEITIRGKCG